MRAVGRQRRECPFKIETLQAAPRRPRIGLKQLARLASLPKRHLGMDELQTHPPMAQHLPSGAKPFGKWRQPSE